MKEWEIWIIFSKLFIKHECAPRFIGLLELWVYIFTMIVTSLCEVNVLNNRLFEMRYSAEHLDRDRCKWLPLFLANRHSSWLFDFIVRIVDNLEMILLRWLVKVLGLDVLLVFNKESVEMLDHTHVCLIRGLDNHCFQVGELWWGQLTNWSHFCAKIIIYIMFQFKYFNNR